MPIPRPKLCVVGRASGPRLRPLPKEQLADFRDEALSAVADPPHDDLVGRVK